MANSKRKCRNCKEYFRVKAMTPNYIKWCSPECREAMALEALHKVQHNKVKLRERAERKAKTKDRVRRTNYWNNDYRHQFKLAKQAAQKLANVLDKDLPCICCDEPRGNAQWSGGHYKTAGGHPELALNMINIHGQRNALCNGHKSGNLSGDKHSKGFTQGIIDRYGQEMVDYLQSYHPPKNYTCEELITIKKAYRKEVRYIERHGQPSKDWRELESEL